MLNHRGSATLELSGSPAQKAQRHANIYKHRTLKPLEILFHHPFDVFTPESFTAHVN